MVCVHKGPVIRELFHRQDFFFVNFAYRGDYGALSYRFDNRITVHENECYIGQPYAGYALSAESAKEIVIVGVLFQRGAFFRTFFPALSGDPRLFRFFLAPRADEWSEEFIRVRFRDSRRIRQLLELMAVEYANPREDTQEVLQPLALALLMLVARESRDSAPGKEEESPSERIVRFMGERPDRVTLTDCAKRFGYHPNYVSTLLRHETGKTFSEILLKLRMERASSLIAGTDLPVEQVSLMTGYPNTSNFYKAFRSFYGKSPREWAKKNGTDARKENG